MAVRVCSNDNHRRTIVSVRFCASCGSIVNENVAVQRCSEANHARMRRVQTLYCVHCGEQLVRVH
jgi:hypothetical protein